MPYFHVLNLYLTEYPGLVQKNSDFWSQNGAIESFQSIWFDIQLRGVRVKSSI